MGDDALVVSMYIFGRPQDKKIPHYIIIWLKCRKKFNNSIKSVNNNKKPNWEIWDEGETSHTSLSSKSLKSQNIPVQNKLLLKK